MINYEAPAELLDPLVPAGVELDRWRNTLYVSVVGFLFQDTRVLGLAIPGHRSFEEVNLRFYVRREVPDETRRGVVFIRELVPRRAIALVARLLYNEPYRAVPMSHRFVPNSRTGTDRQYAWRAGDAWTTIHATADGPPRQLEVGSEEEFITEHYWGYTRQRDGATVEYEVTHPVWRVWQAAEPTLAADVVGLYGPAFGDALSRPVVSALIAEGSAITVHRPRRFMTRVS